MTRGTSATKYGKVRKINIALHPRVYRDAPHGSASDQYIVNAYDSAR